MKSLFLAVCVGLLFLSCSMNPVIQNPATENSSTRIRASGEPVAVRGELGSGYVVARSSAREVSSASSSVTAVARIPVVAGAPDLNRMTKTPIAADGSFTVNVTPDADEFDLFLLVNENATSLEEKAAGFLAMKSASGSELVSIPLDFLKRDLDFGTLNSDGKDAVSTSSLESEQDAFNMSFDELLETSYMNSLYKAAENDYVNHDLVTNEWYRYVYGQSFAGPLGAAEGTFSSAESILATRRYSIGVTVLDPVGYTPEQVVSKSVSLEVVPPEEIAIPLSTDTFGPSNPLSSSAPPSSFVVRQTQPSALPDGFTSGCEIGGSVRDPLDGGLWHVKVSGVEKALFDMDPAVSFTPQGRFMFYVPSFGVETDASGLVTAVTLNWLAWDPPSGQYRPVSDLSTFLRVGSGWMIGLNASSPETHEYFDKGTRVTQFAHKWYISNPPSDGLLLNMVTTGYAIAGFSFAFSLVQ